jgi:hypothetical protein
MHIAAPTSFIPTAGFATTVVGSSGFMPATQPAQTPREVFTDESTVDIGDGSVDVGFIPNGIYTFRIKEIKQANSSKGNPLDTLTLEILSPVTVQHGSQTIEVAGREATWYLSYGSPKAIMQVATALRTVGFALVGQVKVKELRDKVKTLLGYAVQGTVRSEEQFEQKSLTDEEIASGKEREDLLGLDGKPISTGWRLNFKQPVGRAYPLTN